MAAILLFWTGAVVGSFLNVCIWRLSRGESVVAPRSYCPRCRGAFAAYDNIPILSFLWLRGRCRRCRRPISIRYPIVEIVSGIVLWGMRQRWGWGAWFVAAYAAAAALLVVAFIDWDSFLIPDVLSLGLLAGGVLCAPVNPYFSGVWFMKIGWSLAAAAGGVLGCWAVAALGEAVFKKEAMGGGDVKLLGAVGAWTGFLGAYDCLLVASLLGSLYGGYLLLRKRIKRQEPIPFGPFLSAGAILNLFYLLPFGFPFFEL
ncbi:MAG: prepilin peptidase [Elusimicrobia bacterium]|nr:prepilin peptidase [Elusimicrobiota bacterium]